MKKIGMVGGIGPESTVDYYKQIIALYRQKTGKDEYPEILVASLNMTPMLRLLADKDFGGLTALLTEAVASLSRAGADFAFIASNTPHIVFKEVQKASPIPLLSIVEATRNEAERLKLKKLALLGTRFTMQSRYYQDELIKGGIAAALPTREEQDYIHEKLFSEIEHGIFLPETKAGLLHIVERLIKDEAVDGVILGCTELPLILTRDEFGLPFLNTTKIHVERVIKYLVD